MPIKAVLPAIDSIGLTPRQLRLAAEFAVLFVVAPLVMAVLLPPKMMFPALFAVTIAGLLLLQITPGYSWRMLRRNRLVWWALVPMALGPILVGLWAVPDPFAFALNSPLFLAMIFLLYPILSALPQELVFRVLFFERYAPILPGGAWPSIILNAALFSLAHLMYWSPLVMVMTFAGGLAFGWAWRIRGSFGTALAMHAVAGNAVFLVGLGLYFYSGNVTRPF